MRDSIVRIDRKRYQRFDDYADSWRDHPIYPTQVIAVPVVVKPQIEVIKAQAGDHLHVPGEYDLILSISRSQVCSEMIVGVSRALAKGNRRANRRTVIGNDDRRSSAIKEPCFAKITGQLAPHFGPRQEGVLDAPRRPKIGQVCLIENVPSFGRIVVSRESDSSLIGRHHARYEILIASVIDAKHRAIANVQAT